MNESQQWAMTPGAVPLHRVTRQRSLTTINMFRPLALRPSSGVGRALRIQNQFLHS